jgi:hypothetical protein
MTLIQSRSGSAPLAPEVLTSAVAVLRRGRAMGLLPEPIGDRLDLGLVRELAGRAAAEGVGREAASALQETRLTPARLAGLLDDLGDALEASPLPRQELAQLGTVFDLDAIGRLAGASPISLRRYATGTRQTPDGVAARIHWLALVTGDLRGAYNPIGVRRWFDRPRALLGDRAPRQILSGSWDPDDPDVRAVRALAETLVAPGYAT